MLQILLGYLLNAVCLEHVKHYFRGNWNISHTFNPAHCMCVLHALWGQILPQGQRRNVQGKDRNVVPGWHFPARKDAPVPSALLRNPHSPFPPPPAHQPGVLMPSLSLHLSASFLLSKLDPNLPWATGYQVTGYYFSSLQHMACQSGH